MQVQDPSLSGQGPTSDRLRVVSSSEARGALFLVECGYLQPVRRRLDDLEKAKITHGHTFIWIDGAKGETGLERWTDGRSWGPSRCRDDFLIYEEKTGDNRLTKITYTARRNTFDDTTERLWHLIAYYYEDRAQELVSMFEHRDFAQLLSTMPDAYFVSNRKDKSRKIKVVPDRVRRHPSSHYESLIESLLSPIVTSGLPSATRSPPHAAYTSASPISMTSPPPYRGIGRPRIHRLSPDSYSFGSPAHFHNTFASPTSPTALMRTVNHEHDDAPTRTPMPFGGPPTAPFSREDQYANLAGPGVGAPPPQGERDYRKDQLTRLSPNLAHPRGRAERQIHGSYKYMCTGEGTNGASFHGEDGQNGYAHPSAQEHEFETSGWGAARNGRERVTSMMMYQHRRPGSPVSSASPRSPPLSVDESLSDSSSPDVYGVNGRAGSPLSSRSVPPTRAMRAGNGGAPGAPFVGGARVRGYSISSNYVLERGLRSPGRELAVMPGMEGLAIHRPSSAAGGIHHGRSDRRIGEPASRNPKDEEILRDFNRRAFR